MSKSELRHFCRHCRGKLPAPAANPREAFDSKGCHRSFYRHRCIVCERDMPRLRESQRTCYRADCKEKWRQKTIQSHFVGHSSGIDKHPLKTSIKQGVKEADKYDRRWLIVAGEISPDALHCATVPDGPGGSWGSGSVERIEAQQRCAKVSDETKNPPEARRLWPSPEHQVPTEAARHVAADLRAIVRRWLGSNASWDIDQKNRLRRMSANTPTAALKRTFRHFAFGPVNETARAVERCAQGRGWD